MNIEIVTIGDELLLGFTVDTNAVYLARELAGLGVGVVRRTTCGDSPDDIADAVRVALGRSDGVITTGGLGPTADDRTKAAIAELFGRRLIRDEGIVEWLRAFWVSHGRSGALPESNLVQAMMPEGGRVLRNERGTAPGVLLEDERGRWVAMLPGVPREMRGMFQDALRPIIAELVGDDAPVIASRTIRTTGVAESVLAEQLGDLGHGFDGLEFAFLPGADGVDLRLTSRGRRAEDAEAALHAGAERVRERVGEAAYGDAPGVSLASLVLEMCRERALRLAVAESCTGGLLGARITAVPGASDVFHGGLIAYDNRVKRQLLGVLDADLQEHGAVSEPVVRQMAKGIRIRFGTEVGVAITGVAGPGGGTLEKPVGTVWLGIDVAEGRPPLPRPVGHPPIEPLQRARVLRLVGDRDEVRHRATQAALDMIRRTIEEL